MDRSLVEDLAMMGGSIFGTIASVMLIEVYFGKPPFLLSCGIALVWFCFYQWTSVKKVEDSSA